MTGHKHSTPFSAGGVPIGRVARGLCRPILKKHGLHMADIFLSWSDVIGAHYACFTLPVKLQAASNGQYTLHIQVLREQALEVRYNTPKLLARLNQYFGGERVEALALHIVEEMAAPMEEPSGPSGEDPTAQETPSLETVLARLQHHLQGR
jgi:hypothetical protein